MSAETGVLATTPRPLGKPGGPGLFRDRSLNLPPYVQNIAHSLMTKRGMDKSRAIATAIGTVKRWAAGGGDVKPEVRAAAVAAVAAWEAAKTKARATPNKGMDLSQPMAFLRTIVDGTQMVELATHSLTPEARQKAAKEHAALPDGSFPIRDRAELHKAIMAHGRAQNPEAAKRWIIRRAKQLKATDMLPEGWCPPGDRYEMKLSQPMQLLRSVLDDSVVELAVAPVEGSTKTPGKPAKGKPKQKDPHGKHQLPPGAVGWKHNWVPVDKNGNPVGPSQKNKSAQEIKDMVGHDAATKDAIRQAYANKTQADAAKAATKAKTNAKAASRKAEAAKKRAAAEAKRRAKAKETAAKRKAAETKRQAAAKQRAANAKAKARQKLVTEATRQALADKKAGRILTPSQQRLLDTYERQQAALRDKLRNDVNLAQPVELGASATYSGDYGVSTVSAQDGPRYTVNILKDNVPKRVLADAAKKARKARQGRRKGRK